MPLSATIAASSSGDNSIVSGVTGYAIRVIGYVLSFSGIVNAKWRSGTTDISGLIYGPPATSTSPETVAVPEPGVNARGWFQTASGAALQLNLSAGVAVGGHVLYELVAQ